MGIKLQAFLGWLGNYGHLPYEKQQEMLWELGEIEIGLGTLVTTNQRISQAVNPSVEELSKWVKSNQPNLHFEHTVNLLTVVQTCRRQKRSVINFFEQALMATVRAERIPTLLI